MRSSLHHTWTYSIAAIAAVAFGCATACGAGDVGGGKGADKNNDGVADDLGEAVDKDGDGKPDKFKTGVAVDTDGDGKPDAAGLDTNGDGLIDALDTDFDGKPDVFSKLAKSKGGSGSSSGTGGAGGFDLGGSGGGGGQIGDGTQELCDGVDNDNNGIIDDVDAGGDGICDCLNIGTIGTIGPFSNGGDIFKDWLNSRSPIPATELGDEALTEEKLKKLDVIVVLRTDTAALNNDPAHHAFSKAEVSAFENWVRTGGGAMTTIGYMGNEADEIVNVNTLLAPFDAGYSTSLQDITGNITSWIKHPISENVTTIRADNGVAVKETSGVRVADQDGKAALVALQADDGRLIVFADEWITYDSEWSDTKGQQVETLWLNMIKWLSPPARCQVPLPPAVN